MLFRSTGYFPVENQAQDESLILAQLDENREGAPAIKESIKATQEMIRTYTLYNSKPFQGSFEMRTLLETHLFSKVGRDLEVLNASGTSEEERVKTIELLTSDDAFDAWYADLNEAAKTILGR